MHKFLPSKALQEIFSPLNSLAERGQTASVLWGTQIIAQGAPKTFLSTYNRTSTILNLVVRSPRVLVQKSLLKTQKQSVIYFTAYYHIISPFAGKLTGLVTKARFLSQMELVKKQMIEMAVEWRSFKGIFNLILTSMRFAFMTIT